MQLGVSELAIAYNCVNECVSYTGQAGRPARREGRSLVCSRLTVSLYRMSSRDRIWGEGVNTPRPRTLEGPLLVVAFLVTKHIDHYKTFKYITTKI